jgi:hypothetical protein
MDEHEFHLTMKTMDIVHASVRSFRWEFFTHAQQLVYYRSHLTEAGRLKWHETCVGKMRQGQAGLQRTNRGAMLNWLFQLKQQTFGLRFDDESVNHSPNLVINPWSLSDPEFLYCWVLVASGTRPDPEEFKKKFVSLTDQEQIVADKLRETLVEQALESAEKHAIAMGGAAVEILFKVKKATLVGLATDIGWELFKDWAEEKNLEELKRRYERDALRREYLATVGRSTFKRVGFGGA